MSNLFSPPTSLEEPNGQEVETAVKNLKALSLNDYKAPKNAFPGQYIDIGEEELSCDPFKGLEKYRKYFESEKDCAEDEEWKGEQYEKSWRPKGYDKAFSRFCEIVQENPSQCVRYQFSGHPLQYNQQSVPAINSCPHCGKARVFELQLMPNMLRILPVNASDDGMEWGTVIVYVCGGDCGGDSTAVRYFEECAVMQCEI